MKTVGLRIDVDTLRGTRLGLPALCDVLHRHKVRASVYACVGPDNMGRHLWRLWRPSFFMKMLRSRAPSLYGWDVLFRGTAWPGPRIGERCAAILRDTAGRGHEVGLHAWDHHRWQARIHRMDNATIHRELTRGFEALTRILGTPPRSSAAPGWCCHNHVLLTKELFDFTFNSDCRGQAPCRPLVGQEILKTPQVPVTLPTYDEVIGHRQITSANYNDFLLAQVKENTPEVYTIHAEVEGMANLAMFERLLTQARLQRIHFLPLSELLERYPPTRQARLRQGRVEGRTGQLAILETTDTSAHA